MTREPPRPLSPWSPEYRHLVFRAAARRRQAMLAERDRTSPAGPDDAGVTDEEHSFLRWLFHDLGLDVGQYRFRTLRRRIPACLRALRAGTCAEARRALEKTPALRSRAFSTLVIGVTSFFRDAALFQALRDELLTPLLAGRLGLAAWCVGCSDGPELYSLAMLLDDLGHLRRCHLLGTDCRADAIRRAREGLYDSPALRGIPQDVLDRHFSREAAEQWRVKPSLRAAVHWRTANALTVHEPGVWDVIFCRNMSMYLVPDAAAALWRRLEDALRPGGLLVLGKAERPSGARHLTAAAPCVYRRGRGMGGDA